MKTQNIKIFITSIFTFALLMSASVIAEEHGHAYEQAGHNDEKDNGHKEHADHKKEGGDHKGGHGEESGAIKLTPAQIKQAGIETEIIKRLPQLKTVTAPGSVAFNGYRLADVTALVDGVVHARHVRLGDEVQKGQRLVTLTSSELAQAEADYLRAEAEHRKNRLDLKRLEGLVKEKIVSQARLQQAQSSYQAAHANLAASEAALSSYGMSKKEMAKLMKATHYGQLTLHAPGAGTIVSDDFHIGQHIGAGSRLLQVVDESTVWVEVKLSQSQMAGISVGRSAVVATKGGKSHYQAKVINIHHQLDQTTRTGGVRLEVKNPEDALHPGMFVNAEIEAGSGEKALLLPEQAIQRQGAESIVFAEEEPGHFERREVEVGKTGMGLVSILEGVAEGEPVVVKGAFILASELAKSGFEVHNH